jgi:hypothetical protein
MKEFEFELIFELQSTKYDIYQCLDSLFENGCDDATISLGQAKILSFAFIREAFCISSAISSAIDDVQRAIPSAKLVKTYQDT